MNVKDFFFNVRFTSGSLDDTSGRATNNLFTNKQIATQANMELFQYANITKGIQDVYSFPLDTSQPFVAAPPLALRSEAYSFCVIYQNGIAFPLDMRNIREGLNNFRYRPIQGITNWIVPWGAGKEQFFSVFPTNALAPKTTTIVNDILPTDTTINLTDAQGFLIQEGRITIGEEKILYRKIVNNIAYNCERGVEDTVAASHLAGDTVTQNNVVLYYARLSKPIEVHDDDFMTKAELSREIEVCEEHVQGILKATCYNLLLKVDPDRADNLKQDYMLLYSQYATDIKKGYYRNHSRGIRNPYQIAETGVAFGTNLLY